VIASVIMQSSRCIPYHWSSTNATNRSACKQITIANLCPIASLALIHSMIYTKPISFCYNSRYSIMMDDCIWIISLCMSTDFAGIILVKSIVNQFSSILFIAQNIMD
jgi:hypothetical protein